MKAEIPMRDVVSQLTLQVDVTGVRVARVRMWLGMRLLKLAVRVLGCGMEVRA